MICISSVYSLLIKSNSESKLQINIEAVDNGGWTSLILAGWNGRTEIVQLLLNANANIEAMDHEYGQTSLIWASENGYTEIVQLLLDANANIEAVDDGGRTSLSWAAENGHTEVVRLLTSYAQGVKKNIEPVTA